jgi:hypothetical protein
MVTIFCDFCQFSAKKNIYVIKAHEKYILDQALELQEADKYNRYLQLTDVMIFKIFSPQNLAFLFKILLVFAKFGS